jgi:hypothetical protein
MVQLIVSALELLAEKFVQQGKPQMPERAEGGHFWDSGNDANPEVSG